MIDIPRLKDYNTSSIHQIVIDYKNLHTFDDMTRWAKQAAVEVESIRSALKSVEVKLQLVEADIERARRAYQSKSLLARLFAGQPIDKRLVTEQARLLHEQAQMDKLIKQLETAISALHLDHPRAD
jgi:hypothetical protein